MKQLILTGILSFFYLSSYAQILTINEFGSSTDISGTTYSHSLSAPASDLHIVDFMINNETASTQPWLVTRKILNQPAGWNNFFCWGVAGQIGNCYDATADIVFDGGMVLIPAGESGVLSTYVTAPNGGCSDLRYYISVDSVNYIDSVDMQVCFNLGVADLNAVNFTMAPNPAQTQVVINSSEVSVGTLQIIDAMGRMIRTEEVVLPYSVDVNNLENGSYFLRLAIDDDRILQQKLVVRH